LNTSFQEKDFDINELAISAFSKPCSDKEKDRGNDQEEDQKLSPAETAVVSAHLNTSFQGRFKESADQQYPPLPNPDPTKTKIVAMTKR
jgi:hypothetical protein